MFKLIGITGVIASGKTTVSNYIKEKGYNIIEADTLARVAVEKNSQGLKKIKEEFGEEVIQENGELNRKKLKEIIFNDETLRRKLNSIIHPEIESIFQKKLKEFKDAGEKIVFYDVPLLFETGMEWMFDSIIVVFVPESISLERLIKRDNLSEEFALKIIKSQIPAENKIKMANYVINNSKSIENTFEQLEKIISNIHQN
ncbi:dephospho-CoA kinase [bacterium]|nr:dephospho-CoA kinase [bacterium]